MTDYTTTFIAEGLRVNETGIIVVTAQHREELLKTFLLGAFGVIDSRTKAAFATDLHNRYLTHEPRVYV